MTGTETELLGVCKAHAARGADFCATVAALYQAAPGSPAAIELERQADALLSQFEALGRVVIATPASDLPGIRAKLAVLCALHDQLGDGPRDGSCRPVDLARSLLADACQLAA